MNKKLRVKLFLLSILCITSVSLSAADKKALVGGTLIDGMGGKPIQDSVILVEGTTITGVGTVATLKVPDDYQVISTEGMSVLPGLWDMHVHLMITGHSDYPHWHKEYLDKFSSEIMPAAAVQLLLAGVTSARDLGAPLKESIEIKNKINSGEIPGPRLYVSGPFIQHKAYPGTDAYRWGVKNEADARKKINKLADAGVDVIKLIDHDEMTLSVAKAVVEQAHKRNLKVVGHSHKPDEIRRGLEIGIDNFEHTGLTSAPEYPEDIMVQLKERTAKGRISGGPLFWTPTIEGLWNYDYVRDYPEELDNSCWKRGLAQQTIDDIKQSIAHPDRLDYMQLTPKRKPTLKRKFKQLRDAGVVQLIGTDSGIPMKFHCQSTWHELEMWVNVLEVPAMETIRAATYWPAKFMGVHDKVGTLVPGKYADIIAVKGDVLKYINLLQDVDLVMKNGVLYKENGQVNEQLVN